MGPRRSSTIETVDVTSETQHRPGQPRPERDAAFLERFDARMRPPIAVSAILPLVVVPEAHGWVGVVVGIATWLVFGVDYVVRVRHLEHYGRTGFGRFRPVRGDRHRSVVPAPRRPGRARSGHACERS